jgi:aspartate-semialdehyde dehydrogenase
MLYRTYMLTRLPSTCYPRLTFSWKVDTPNAENLAISATCVRVPVFVAHSEAVHIEFTEYMSPEEARSILSKSPGIKVLDDPNVSLYPQPWLASGTDEVYVGRIRSDASYLNGLVMWIVSDNIRKGAALNAIHIAV